VGEGVGAHISIQWVPDINNTCYQVTYYMVMSQDRNAERGHSVKIDDRSIEKVEEFKYLKATLIDQNSIQEQIKSRLKLGNACCYSVQNLLSSKLLSRNLKIKIYRTIILPVVLYGCETEIEGGT
jgi:hypothetical protein